MTDEALAWMPHKGPMMLIAGIDEMAEDHVRCHAKDHTGPAYPLRCGDTVPGIALVELGAQAAAAHASMHGVGGVHTGLLLALRKVEVHVVDASTLPAPLDISATRVGADGGGAQYSFTVHTAGPVTDHPTSHPASYPVGKPIVSGEAVLSMRGTS